MGFFPGDDPSVSHLLSSNFENIHIVGGISLISQILLTSQHLLGTIRNNYKMLPVYRWQLRQQPQSSKEGRREQDGCGMELKEGINQNMWSDPCQGGA